jgi:hypothetical protein
LDAVITLTAEFSPPLGWSAAARSTVAAAVTTHHCPRLLLLLLLVQLRAVCCHYLHDVLNPPARRELLHPRGLGCRSIERHDPAGRVTRHQLGEHRGLAARRCAHVQHTTAWQRVQRVRGHDARQRLQQHLPIQQACVGEGCGCVTDARVLVG